MDLSTKDGADLYVREVVMSGAEECFQKDGHVNMVAFLFVTLDPSSGATLESPCVVMVPPPPGYDKDSFSGLVRSLAGRFKAVGVAMVFEAWMVRRPPEALGGGPAPSMDPNREECVYLALEHVTGSRVWLSWITRDDSGSRMSRWEGGDTGQLTGRFAGMMGFWQ